MVSMKLAGRIAASAAIAGGQLAFAQMDPVSVPSEDSVAAEPTASSDTASLDAVSLQASSPISAPSDASVIPTIPVEGAVESTGAAEESSPNRLSSSIEEIIITAQKRAERLQDVPISVQAFSAEALADKGIDNPTGLQSVTPGLQYNIFAGYSLIYIRGVGTDAFIPSADPSVATYIDGVYNPISFGLASALGAIERVEVLKGPQGTLFGRNSTAGAINIVTQSPGPDFGGSLEASIQNYSNEKLRGFINVPVTDMIAVSLAGLYYTEDPYYKLAYDNPRQSQADEKSQAVSGKLGWTPTDDLKIRLSYTYLHQETGQYAALIATDIKPLGTLLGVHREPDYRDGEDAPVFNKTTSNVGTLDVQYRLTPFDFRFIGALQHIKVPASADFDGSSQPIASFQSPNPFAKSQTAELQLLSNDESWGAGWLKFVGGLFYLNSHAGYDPVFISAGPDATVGLLGTGVVPQTLVDLLGSLPIDPSDGVNLKIQGVLGTRSGSAYFQSTADVTDWFAVTLGGRYQVEKRTLEESNLSVATAPETDAPSIPVPGTDRGGLTETRSNFSPKLTFDFVPAQDQLIYLGYSKGFKSGTYNIVNITQSPEYLKPEIVTTYELGYKSTWLDGSLRLNAAVFQNSIDNLQVQTFSLLSGGVVRFETAGGARIRGSDFDIVWKPLPQSLPGLSITGGGAYLDGTYTDYKSGSGFNETTGLYETGQDYTGNKTVRTPTFSGNGEVSYLMVIESGMIEAAFNAYYNSGFYYSAQNLSNVQQSAYEIFNARLSYSYDPWAIKLTAFVQNMTSKHYYVGIQELDFATTKLLASPRTYGLRLNWSF